MSRLTSLTVLLILAIVAVGCQSPTPEPTATPAPTNTATSPPTVTVTNTPLPSHTPTATPTSTPTLEPTTTPTETATLAPTETPTTAPALVVTQPTVVAATQPPVVVATKPPAQASGSVYGSTTGPAGFATTITCFTAGGGACASVMPPGDINFTFTLGSAPDAPWALFLPYGLSVEKDGVNAEGMFMFVDAGWLPPGFIVQFGGSRNFTEPGRYVIRSSGCMLTTSNQCAWTTMGGTTVTFVIQP